jgi:hypothetical protein
MEVGDKVRTKMAWSSYGYEKPVCVIVGKKTRIDGMYFEIIDPEGNTLNWWPEELEVVSE